VQAEPEKAAQCCADGRRGIPPRVRRLLAAQSKMIVAIAVTTLGVLPANVALSKATDVLLAGSDQTKTLIAPVAGLGLPAPTTT
jgi:hypothetical protein